MDLLSFFLNFYRVSFCYLRKRSESLTKATRKKNDPPVVVSLRCCRLLFDYRVLFFFTEFRRFQRAPNENDHRIRSKKEETRKMRNDLRVLVDVFFFYLE